MDLEQLNTHISQLTKNLENMDEYLLKTGSPHKDKPINHGLYEIRKSAIRVEFELDALEIRNNVEYKDSRKKLEKLKKNIKLFTDYNSMVLQHKQKTSIDLISLIGLIFLPFGIITGYFGMNFKGMGECGKKTVGVFSIKYPNLFVFILFVISTIIIGYFYFNMHDSRESEKI
jgi:hypothetical protein